MTQALMVEMEPVFLLENIKPTHMLHIEELQEQQVVVVVVLMIARIRCYLEGQRRILYGIIRQTVAQRVINQVVVEVVVLKLFLVMVEEVVVVVLMEQ
jgi:hypothetical protein